VRVGRVSDSLTRHLSSCRLHHMRKLLVLILSSGILIGGLYLIIIETFFAHIMYRRFVVGGAVLAVAGAYLIWVDFVAPRLGVKTWEDSR
jgi:hypothetical protein